jgi:lipid-binding SYLF domain-containing protein
MISMHRWFAGVVILASACGAVANEAAKGQEVVDKATATYKQFIADPDMSWFRSHVKQAKGMLIVPHYGKAGFIIGGAGGSGLLIGNNPAKGWSNPAFYTMAEASIGLQIGAEGSQIIFLIMTDTGMEKMIAGKAKLGADMNVAVGPVGGGATVETADVYAFAKSKGAYGGVSAEGGVVQVFSERNSAYYGKAVSPQDIVFKHAVSNDGAKALIAAVSGK